jgi:2-iminobutanoate/2-iminopropanoate deaminase
MKRIHTEDAFVSSNPLSQGIRSHDHLFVSGQTGMDPETGDVVAESVSEQTAQIFHNTERILESEGATLDDIVRITAYLVDFADKPEFNDAYRSILSEPYPARAVIGGVELSPGMKVELEITAEL